jgi:hypothetical protein
VIFVCLGGFFDGRRPSDFVAGFRVDLGIGRFSLLSTI